MDLFQQMLQQAFAKQQQPSGLGMKDILALLPMLKGMGGAAEPALPAGQASVVPTIPPVGQATAGTDGTFNVGTANIDRLPGMQEGLLGNTAPIVPTITEAQPWYKRLFGNGGYGGWG